MTTTIQQTSKSIKLTIFVGALMFWASLITLFIAEEISTKDLSAWFLMLGIVTYVIGIMLRWWKHA